MTKTMRVALGLLLCLVLCVCLLPAAWADGQGAETFAALKQAIANGDTYFNMDNCGDVVFTEDLRIPQNLKVEGSFTKVIVPENVHLTVLGELWVDDFAILGNCNVQEGGKVCVTNLDANGKQYFEGEVTGGVLNIGDGTEVITVETHYGEGAHLYFNEIHYGEDSRISRNHNVVNATELSGAIAAAQQPHDSHIAEFIRVMFPWTISADMTIPEGISQDNLQVFVMKGLTVNRGATLTVDGVLNCSSPVVFNGAVVNNARIAVPNVQDLSSGAIVKVNGSYSGYGDLAVHDSEELADSYFSGIDLNQFRRIIRPGYVYYDAIRNDVFQALKAAIANGATYFNMIDCDTVVFTEDITIPSTMHLEARDTLIIIPNGVTMTVEGFNNLGFVTVQPGGHVTVNDTGKANFAVHQGLIFDSVDQFTVNGNMHIDHKVWEDELRNLDLGPNAGVEVAFNVDNNDELLAALNANLDFPNGQFVKWICIGFDCTLTDDFSIDGFDLSVGGSWTDGQPKGSLTIPAGKTLTIVDRLRTEDAPIYLQGIMVNHGQFFVEKIKSTGALLIRSGNGSYYGGDIVVHADMDKRDACLEGFGTSLYKRYVGEWGTSYGVDNSGIFTALKQAIADGKDEFNMRNCGRVVFTESITIPNTMDLHAKGTEIVIPNNVTLTIERYCSVGTLTVQPGGHVTVADKNNANLTIVDGFNYDNVNQFTVNRYMEIKDYMWRDDLKNLSFGEKGALAVTSRVASDEELQAAMAMKPAFPSKSFQRNIHIEYDWELYDDLDIQGFKLYVEAPGSSLTIKRSAALTIYDRLRVRDGHIKIEGAVINHGEFLVHRNERLEGALVTMTETGNFVGTKPIAVFGDNPDSCLEGFDLNLFEKELVPGGGGMDVTIYSLAEQPLFTELKAAIADGAPAFNMNNRGTLLITENVTIPANMKLDARENCAVVVAGGATLTVDGMCKIRLFDILNGGHVTVGGSGRLELHHIATFSDGNQFTVNGCLWIHQNAWIDSFLDAEMGQNAKVEVWFNTTSDNEFQTAIAWDPGFPDERFAKTVNISYDCSLTADLIVDVFRLTVEAPGSLTIPAGKTLTFINKVATHDAPIYVKGRMIGLGYGYLSILREESTGALLNISDNGQYFGKEIQVEAPKDQRDACISGLDVSKLGKIINPAYSVYYIPVEVVLPDNLTAIEADAFANGGFHTVYIPAGVTSIDSDAFSGTDLVIIYGVPSTLAEDFADANGVSFMRLPNWYDVHDQQFVIIHTA